MAWLQTALEFLFLPLFVAVLGALSAFASDEFNLATMGHRGGRYRRPIGYLVMAFAGVILITKTLALWAQNSN